LLTVCLLRSSPRWVYFWESAETRILSFIVFWAAVVQAGMNSAEAWKRPVIWVDSLAALAMHELALQRGGGAAGVGEIQECEKGWRASLASLRRWRDAKFPAQGISPLDYLTSLKAGTRSFLGRIAFLYHFIMVVDAGL